MSIESAAYYVYLNNVSCVVSTYIRSQQASVFC